MICQVCKTNPVTIPVATTCSLECACKLDPYPCEPLNYGDVKVRLAKAIADAKKWTRKNSKAKS